MRIAVLVDKNDRITEFEKGGTVKIFQKADGVWSLEKETEYSIQGLETPDLFRDRLCRLCGWMEPCKILAAGKFRGTYRVVFERFQIAMWEMEGFSQLCPNDFLDNIYQFYTQEKKCAKPKTASFLQTTAPVEVGPGYFSVDLTDVMAHRTTLNSRQVLLPFFQNTKFKELEILCEHVPKWFANELPKFNLKAEEEVCENRMRIKVFPV